ncbi:insulinase family protein [Acerihabitans sp. KWT182]|uniref:Insulinase family protein n=1 Tax=Acerihabitans sp. KWT182 TaxID=3157919 RepID=A0AAU7QF47_9GAMM
MDPGAGGGRLNATTRSESTAYFFAVEPAKLAPGLARLTDMLVAPLFDPGALEQEVSVIDAEYRLLMTDAQTLCDAAQLYLFDGAPALRRFQVGSRAAFGPDLPSLRQALRDFHQRYYHAGHMTLALQGPQPPAELRTLAERCCACLPPSRAVIPAAGLRLTARGDAGLHAAGPPRLRLSFALNDPYRHDDGWPGVFRVLLTDEADGGLMAWLREHASCDGVRFIDSWRGAGAAIVAAEFTLAAADPALGARVESAFFGWLDQLCALSVRQLRHYARLAWRRFDGQTPLDQLRQLAFAPPAPPRIDVRAWRRWLLAFRREGLSRLWISEQEAETPIRTRGFDLRLAPFAPVAVADPPPTLRFHAGRFPLLSTPGFYPEELSAPPPLKRGPDSCRTMPVKPGPDSRCPTPLSSGENSVRRSTFRPVADAGCPPRFHSLPSRFSRPVTLSHIAASGTAVLTLSPAPGGFLGEVTGHVLQAALRAPAANLAHGGGELRIEKQQGVWLLQLSADNAMLPSVLEMISARLQTLPTAAISQGQRAWRHEWRRERGDIPVRRLLSRLPRWLSEKSRAYDGAALQPQTENHWQAVLYGGGAGLRQRLARSLQHFPSILASPVLPVTATASASVDKYPLTAVSSRAAESPMAATSACSRFPAAAPVPAPAGTPAARHTLRQREGDNALILFCPEPGGDMDARLAWRLLALIYQPLFFQQLRVEQNIGYVVHCVFHHTAWRSGVLFALQSPHLGGDALHQRTLAFLQQMEQRLADMPSALLAERRATLWGC